MNEPSVETAKSRNRNIDEWIAWLLYNGFILPLLYLAFRISGRFHDKIRKGIAGRRALFRQLEQAIAATGKSGPVVLIHAASMGEYEQARPVIREVRRRRPDVRIVASVFSPSAYDHIRGKSEADVVTYLPFDSPRQMRRFLRLIDPAVLLIVRYELWPNFIWQARQLGTHIALIDASVQAGSFRRRWPARLFYRALFKSVHSVLAISEDAAENMRIFLARAQDVRVCGDTRFDQVVFRAHEKKPEELLPASVLQHGPFWIAGSTWPEDEAVVLPAFARLRQQHSLRLVLVPHEPSPAHVQQAESRCRELGLRPLRLSQFDQTAEWDVLIVDRVGILANLYAMGQVAFVGGSFGPGVHSVIEPAAHGLPVLFGPRMRNSPEAVDMLREGCGFVVRDVSECVQRLGAWLEQPQRLRETAEKARQFVDRRCGASKRIAEFVAELLLFNEKKR